MRVFTLSELNQLRREAKHLKKEAGISYCKALDEIAVAQGWANWPMMFAAAQPGAESPEQREARRSEAARFYVHGDESEEESGQYYCEFCDRFELREHFESSHDDASWRRTLKSLESWRKLPFDTKRQYFRPEGASNLHRETYPTSGSAPNPSSQRNQASGMFHSWLCHQDWRPDAIGDFARMVAFDVTYPVGSDSIEVIRSHVSSGSPQEREALEEAWEHFLETLRRPLGNQSTRAGGK